MDSKKLIELKSVRTELYGLSNLKYRNSSGKEKIWKRISDELNKTVCVIILF